MVWILVKKLFFSLCSIRFDLCYTILGDKMKKLTVLFTSLLLFAGCSAKENELQKFSADTLNSGFDTFITLVGYTENQETFDSYFNELKDQFSYYNMLFDKYNTYSEYASIKEINDNAGIAPVKVEPAVIELIDLAKDFYELTNGQFDITFGPVLEIWHDYRTYSEIAMDNDEPTKIPPQSLLEEAAKCTGFDLVEIDYEASTVYLTKECAALDVGGIAKGFAAEKVAQSLEENGLQAGIVNAGGNVRTIGSKPDGKDWVIGVQEPDKFVNNSLGNLRFTTSKSVVTSGDYERYYIYEDQVIHHIIDPTTLYPSTYARAVTVFMDNSGYADLLSTILFTVPYDQALSIINEISAFTQEDIGAIWIYDDTVLPPAGVETITVGAYKLVVTENIKPYFEAYTK